MDPTAQSYETSRKTCPSGGILPAWLVAALLTVASTIPGGLTDARVFVLRPDGTGDVPTFQAGVDSLFAGHEGDDPDTLLVATGRYREDVVVEPSNLYNAVIHCPQGPEATELRSLRGFHASPQAAGWRLTISGLRVRGRVDFGNPNTLRLENCSFLGNVEIAKIFALVGSGIVDCEFQKRLYVNGLGLRIRGCRFSGKTARLALWSDWSMNVENCVFDGGADTAVVTLTNPTDGINFKSCQFRDAGTGIAVTLDVRSPGPTPYQGVRLEDCSFENIAGAAVYVRPSIDDGRVRGVHVTALRTRFENCGVAIDGRSGPPLRLEMSDDTLVACRRDGIDARIYTALLESVQIRGGSRDGAVLRLGESGSASVTGCLFANNAGDGLVVMDGRVFGGETEGELLVRNNTSAFNGGGGIRLTRADESSMRTGTIENNLVARNLGVGLRVRAPFAGSVRRNDAWMNQRGDYAGIVDPAANLTLDPQLCDPASGNFQVAASSPCAPSGPFGQIGAFGVGCEGLIAQIEVEPERTPSHEPSLSLAAPSPQTAGVLSLVASLPEASDATLEVFDVSGRRVLSNRVRADGAARRNISVQGAATLPGGFYVVRLAQAGRVVTAKVVLLR